MWKNFPIDFPNTIIESAVDDGITWQSKKSLAFWYHDE